MLSDEVLSRTSPDLRDLIVALAAGVAGAYATVRPDVSGALPGVAIAVALVPPLATIGITMQAGRGDLIGGAILLYSANLVAIILVATLVFVVTGFVPRSRLETKGVHVRSAVVVLTAATVAIAVPLAIASISAADAGSERANVHDAVSGWNANTGNELDEVRLDGDVVHARISGPNPPPDTTDLERSLAQIVGPSVTLEISWTQTHNAAEIADAASDAVDEAETAAVGEIVDDWLQEGGVETYDVTGLDIDDDEIVIDLVSADPPPDVDELSTRLFDTLQVAPAVVINWTQRTMLTSGGDEDSIAAVERDIDAVVRQSAAQREEFVIDDVRYDGELVTVELRGPRSANAAALRRAITNVAGPDVEIDLWLTERELID